MAVPLLARIVRFGGGKLLDRAVGRLLPATGAARTNSTLGKGLTGAALTRIATRSVPGAILIGGGLLAKMLYDRRHASPAAGTDPVMADEDDGDAIG